MKKPKYTLEELLEQITEKNLHQVIEVFSVKSGTAVEDFDINNKEERNNDFRSATT